jgi:hypothetical protein
MSHDDVSLYIFFTVFYIKVRKISPLSHLLCAPKDYFESFFSSYDILWQDEDSWNNYCLCMS